MVAEQIAIAEKVKTYAAIKNWTFFGMMISVFGVQVCYFRRKGAFVFSGSILTMRKVANNDKNEMQAVDRTMLKDESITFFWEDSIVDV